MNISITYRVDNPFGATDQAWKVHCPKVVIEIGNTQEAEAGRSQFEASLGYTVGKTLSQTIELRAGEKNPPERRSSLRAGSETGKPHSDLDVPRPQSLPSKEG